MDKRTGHGQSTYFQMANTPKYGEGKEYGYLLG